MALSGKSLKDILGIFEIFYSSSILRLFKICLVYNSNLSSKTSILWLTCDLGTLKTEGRICFSRILLSFQGPFPLVLGAERRIREERDEFLLTG